MGILPEILSEINVKFIFRFTINHLPSFLRYHRAKQAWRKTWELGSMVKVVPHDRILLLQGYHAISNCVTREADAENEVSTVLSFNIVCRFSLLVSISIKKRATLDVPL